PPRPSRLCQRKKEVCGTRINVLFFRLRAPTRNVGKTCGESRAPARRTPLFPVQIRGRIMSLTNRRNVLVGFGAVAATLGSQSRSGRAQTAKESPDLILFNGKVSTLDRQNPSATAIAIADGRFVAVGSDSDILQRAAANVPRVDLKGRRVIPGLID